MEGACRRSHSDPLQLAAQKSKLLLSGVLVSPEDIVQELSC